MMRLWLPDIDIGIKEFAMEKVKVGSLAQLINQS